MLEQEIKLTATTRATLQQVLASDIIRRLDTGGGADAVRYLGRYYDTTTRTLQQHRYTLRARREGTRHRAALKFGGQLIDGVSQRQELETDITGWLTTPADLPPGELQTEVQKLIAPNAPLSALITVDMQRTTRNLTHNGTHIELAADTGTIKTAHQQVTLHEIELELKQGDLTQAIALGNQLIKLFALTPSLMTKHAIGLQLT